MSVRDDRPFGGKDPPAGLFYASAIERESIPSGHLAGYAGILDSLSLTPRRHGRCPAWFAAIFWRLLAPALLGSRGMLSLGSHVTDSRPERQEAVQKEICLSLCLWRGREYD